MIKVNHCHRQRVAMTALNLHKLSLVDTKIKLCIDCLLERARARYHTDDTYPLGRESDKNLFSPVDKLI